MLISNTQCPLCLAENSSEAYFKDSKREYLCCTNCYLVYVSPPYLPSSNAERTEYELHENSFEDKGYIQFLQRLLVPLKSSLNAVEHRAAIDFGCGPSPVLAALLNDCNLERVAIYDPFFYPNNSVLVDRYDVITCTEAIEHFHTPHREWNMWRSMLNPNGIIAIMTKRVIDKTRFASWHYKNDPTHVSFFSENTFRFLAQRDGFDIQFPTNDVVLMKKL